MNRRTLVLTAHSLRRVRYMLLALGLILAGFEFLLTQVAAYLTRQSAFGQLSALIPEFVRTVAGPSTLAFMSFGGIVGLGYFHPIVIAALVALMITIATEPAAEVESRFVDLALARPLGRMDVIARTVLLLAMSGIMMLGVMVAGTWAGLACCAPADVDPPSLRTIVLLAITLGAQMACWAGVAVAISSGTRRRAVGGAIAGALAFAAYLLDYLGRAWEPARAISTVSPFHYFESMPIIMGEPLDLRNMAVLAAVAIAGVVIGGVVFVRRDI